MTRILDAQSFSTPNVVGTSDTDVHHLILPSGNGGEYTSVRTDEDGNVTEYPGEARLVPAGRR